MLAKLFIIAVFLGIVGSLGSALFFMMHTKHDPNRMLRALTWRIALSIALFFLLFIAYAAGLIAPHGIVPH
jgi:hypothetical protein